MTKYWRSIDQLHDPEAFKTNEAKLELDAKRAGLKEQKSSRRDFLKTLGFSVTAAAVVASCKRPVHKAIPYLVKPEEVSPGMANYYASSYFEGNEYCSILVKVRDGRPIKIEGNSLSSISRQGTSARVQASLLNLYDDFRFKTPLKRGSAVTRDEAESYIGKKINQFRNENKKLVLLTGTIISPTTRKVIEEFTSFNPNADWVEYDPISASGIQEANKLSFGEAIIPDYRFDKAKVILSFNADFLGTWLSSTEYTKAYASGRRVLVKGDEMLRHYQFEPGMSLTGSNADVRFPFKPSDEREILKAIYYSVLNKSGAPVSSSYNSKVDIEDLTKDLWDNKGNSLVVSGSNDVNNQLLVNAINNVLGNYGKTILLYQTLNTQRGSDHRFVELIKEMKNGQVAGLLCWGVNPVYNHPDGKTIADLIKGLDLSVSFADHNDETTQVCHWVCPEPHYLESWNDAEPKTGHFSLAQPAISKLFDSRQVQELLLEWSGGEDSDYYSYLRKNWETTFFDLQSEFSDSRHFWNDALQKGVFEPGAGESPQPVYSENGLEQALTSSEVSANGIELCFYQSVALGNGDAANNPWLHELPDPIAKISWDNFAAVPVNWARQKGLKNEDVVVINGVELPVYLQPGQAEGTISVALGYGRQVSGKVGKGLGKNMYALTSVKNDLRSYWLADANIDTSDKTYELAISQTHHSMEGRPIVRETTFDKWQLDPASGNELKKKHEEHQVSLYPKPEFKGHHWAMAVDLSSCIGCSNCSISCQAENNVQVIGKEQVRNRRIMHWIRIDRYYSKDVENPEVYHQPVMCQHCDNAPCENVCPVSATPHSDEGLNQMAYNRCVGTKYCVNNCPYKVRRFNWFEYVNNKEFDFASNSELGRMVLNPDVTVRSRGVVEKCSFCVQRIQEKKTEAKVAGRKIKDGEIQPACVQSCPADALVFGDLKDPDSRISKLFENKRNYHLLEELHTLPSVGYLTKVRNKKA